MKRYLSRNSGIIHFYYGTLLPGLCGVKCEIYNSKFIVLASRPSSQSCQGPQDQEKRTGKQIISEIFKAVKIKFYLKLVVVKVLPSNKLINLPVS